MDVRLMWLHPEVVENVNIFLILSTLQKIICYQDAEVNVEIPLPCVSVIVLHSTGRYQIIRLLGPLPNAQCSGASRSRWDGECLF
jgi:hypothetical protein